MAKRETSSPESFSSRHRSNFACIAVWLCGIMIAVLLAALLAVAKSATQLSIPSPGWIQVPSLSPTFGGYTDSNRCSVRNNKFRCHNGQCIDVRFMCDGVYNCVDKSDESYHYCVVDECHQSDQFRCASGECLSMSVKCDGKRDCADGSDERRKVCAATTTTTTTAAPPNVCATPAQPRNGSWQLKEDSCSDCRVPLDTPHLKPGTHLVYRCNEGFRFADSTTSPDVYCSGSGRWSHEPVCEAVPATTSARPCNGPNQRSCDGTVRSFKPDKCSVFDNMFECWNGKCIAEKKLCDGVPDCPDGSDETPEHCKVIFCPDGRFQCKYGPCLDLSIRCNGKWDCADGSDESPDLCGPGGELNAEACEVPELPKNGYRWLSKIHCPGEKLNCQIDPETRYLAVGTQLVYRCNKGYRLNDTSVVSCGRRGVWLNVPHCVETLCEDLNDVSRYAKYIHGENDETSNGKKSLKPGTRAKLRCRNSYKQEINDLTHLDTVTCNEKGVWEPTPLKCIPVCGELTRDSSISPEDDLLVPNVPELPWHATIYTVRESRPVCGATIVANDLLITAAHCVYDEATGQARDAAEFSVATGNIHRAYKHRENDEHFVKKSQVKQIYVHLEYRGDSGSYANDIAMLELGEAFVLSAITMPVCLDLSWNSDRVVLESGHRGKIAGSFGPRADIVGTLNEPYLTLGECRAIARRTNETRFVTQDKYCAGYGDCERADNVKYRNDCIWYREGPYACDSNSGGGMAFETNSKWYLRGILSTGIGLGRSDKQTDCDGNRYAVYTKLSFHSQWIQTVIIGVKKAKRTTT